MEKSLIHGLTLFTNYSTIHYIDDRKACYDRQLPEIGLITEMSFGMHQQEVNLLNGVLQNFNHYLSTAYGIANRKYGGHNDRLAGTGQGNVLSGAICRNVSCLIFKQLENMNVGIDLTSPVTRNRIMRLIIAFVDDADFFAYGPNAIQNMLRVISKYNKLYAATGGTGQLKKNNFYAWETVINEYGNTTYKNFTCEITVDNTSIEQIPICNATKSLGVMYTPDSNWTEQFDMMKTKMMDALKKLMVTSVLPHHVHVFYHTYLIKSVYFGCGVIYLTDAQEKELCALQEIPLLRKLRLSTKFPRALMYVNRNSFRLGFLRPKTIIDQLKSKMLVGHTRIRSETASAMLTLHECIQFHFGLSKNFNRLSLYDRYWKMTWIDHAYQALKKRGLDVQNDAWKFRNFSKNTILMDLAVTYSTDASLLKKLNACRLYKRIVYPFELMGFLNNKRTIAFEYDGEHSQIQWDFEFKTVTKPHPTVWKIWRKFLQWLEA